MGSFEAEGNEGFGVSVSVPLPCPDSQPDYPLRHARDSHIYRVCVRLPTTVQLSFHSLSMTFCRMGGRRGVIRFRFCASKSGRFNKRGSCIPVRAILVFDISMYEFDMNQFRSRSFSSHEYTELGFNKTPSRSLKVKICEYETFTVLHSIIHANSCFTNSSIPSTTVSSRKSGIHFSNLSKNRR